MNRRLPRALTTVALLLTAFALALGGIGRADTARAASGTVLILGTSIVNGMESPEAQAAIALGYTVEIATAAAWKAKTTAQFASYSALILGDPDCGQSSASQFVGAAEANAATWAAATTGNVIVIGSDPTYHAYEGDAGASKLIKQGIAFAADTAGRTGAYITLSCYINDFTPKNVPVLAGFGTFKALTREAANVSDDDAHIIPASVPALAGLTDADLANWDDSIHEVFSTWPAPFQPVAIARGESGPYTFTAGDGATGAAYIVARGPAAATETTAVSGSYRAVNPTSLTLTATVKTKAGQPVPSGTVIFTINAETFPVAVVNGVATTTIPGYKLASYGDSTVVKASYAGAGEYGPSQGSGKLTIVRR